MENSGMYVLIKDTDLLISLLNEDLFHSQWTESNLIYPNNSAVPYAEK